MLPENNKSSGHRASAEQIARYYNDNTSKFLKLGGSGATAAIHRAIWAPGVANKAQSFNYLNALVALAVEPLFTDSQKPFRMLDLGCGVGGTATWLAQALVRMADERSLSAANRKVQVTGVTISEAQMQIANQRAEELGLSDKVNFVLGDFSAIPALEPVAAAYAIESFVHAQSAESFFTMAHKQLLPGGRLIICDDFLAAKSGSGDSAPLQAERWVARFRKGWHLNNLLTVQATIKAADEAGFTLLEKHDLSAYVRSFNPALLWLVTTLTRLPVRHAYWQNLSGGTALQVCVRQGWTQYQALVWEKR